MMAERLMMSGFDWLRGKQIGEAMVVCQTKILYIINA